MALQLNITTIHGVNLPDCYARISAFAGDKSVVRVVVDHFADASSRQAGKPPVWSEVYLLDIQDGAHMADQYAAIKLLPAYSSAIDV